MTEVVVAVYKTAFAAEAALADLETARVPTARIRQFVCDPSSDQLLKPMPAADGSDQKDMRERSALLGPRRAEDGGCSAGTNHSFSPVRPRRDRRIPGSMTGVLRRRPRGQLGLRQGRHQRQRQRHPVSGFRARLRRDRAHRRPQHPPLRRRHPEREEQQRAQ
jgi:hypothetical protein